VGTPENKGLDLVVSDVSGQKQASVENVRADATVGELVQSLLTQMNLPPNDPTDRPLTYHALLEREERHLHASERLGDVLESGDRIVLQPNIDAGKRPC
jgi:hypothetical protein